MAKTDGSHGARAAGHRCGNGCGRPRRRPGRYRAPRRPFRGWPGCSPPGAAAAAAEAVAQREGAAVRGRRRTIVAVLAWALLGSRLLVVRSVKVTGGGQAVPAAQVLAAARVRHGTPLIRVNTGTIARQVEALRQVQSVQVSKDWPSTVVITVSHGPRYSRCPYQTGTPWWTGSG